MRAIILSAFKEDSSPVVAELATEFRHERKRSRHLTGIVFIVLPRQLQIDAHRRFMNGPKRPVPGIGRMASPGRVQPFWLTKWVKSMYVGGGRLLSEVSVRGRSFCGELVGCNNVVGASDGVGKGFVSGCNV